MRDSAASLDVTAHGGGSYLTAHMGHPGKLRIIATVHAADGVLAGPAQIAAVEHAATILRDLGHEVRLMDRAILTPVGGWFDLLWIDDIPKLIADHAQEIGREPRQGELEPMTLDVLQILRAAGQGAVAEARLMKAETAARHLELFDDCDILLTPGLGADPAPLGTIGYKDLGSMANWVDAGYRFAPFSIIANVAGQPAASLPLPMDGQHIPIGVQIMAAPHHDLLILQVSRQIETAVNWDKAIVRNWGNRVGEAR